VPKKTIASKREITCGVDNRKGINTKGDLLKYPQNQKKVIPRPEEKKIYSPAHPFLLIKTFIH
jgi:hypothetical protein